ncbi:MAG: hypothetical protein FWG98_09380 [Candidatus Cloacimonetes bacterium]|nr:hypothetical protein [Candidatus Cloacimonadota bacterium]
MKKSIILMTIFLLFVANYANDYLTIYNQNQALFNTRMELYLRSGTQYFSLENIPTTIITESVTFRPRDRSVLLFSQNFEYDLANTQAMMRRYINRNISVITDSEQFSGILVFFDAGNYGLLNPDTNELNIVNSQKVNNVSLAEMPADFYTKPTLRWQLHTLRAGKYQADLSYLFSGISWRATYNVVLGSNSFTLSSWVTINNRSGKDFQNVILKLIAGEVATHSQLNVRGGRSNTIQEFNISPSAAAPSFEEREFSDFRIYTLDQPADIDNNQEKQLSLYPLKTVQYTRKYQYNVNPNERGVNILINFRNSIQAGLGVPLPRGNVNFYEIDDRDNTQQFVGVANLNNTSLNQDVNLRIGTAFDIVPVTTILRNESFGSGGVREIDIEVKLTNNKSETVEIEVIRRLNSSNWQIFNPSIPGERRDATTQIFIVRVPAGGTETLTFMERGAN